MSNQKESLTNKKFNIYRSKKNRVVAGVCGGLAEYLNIDAIIIRIIFFLIILYGGSGILLYLALWLLLPEENSTLTSSKEVIDSNKKEIEIEAKKFAKQAETAVNKKSNIIYIGIFVVLIGCYMLLANLGIWSFLNFDWIFKTFWPLVVIVLGLILLAKSNGK